MTSYLLYGYEGEPHKIVSGDELWEIAQDIAPGKLMDIDSNGQVTLAGQVIAQRQPETKSWPVVKIAGSKSGTSTWIECEEKDFSAVRTAYETAKGQQAWARMSCVKSWKPRFCCFGLGYTAMKIALIERGFVVDHI